MRNLFNIIFIFFLPVLTHALPVSLKGYFPKALGETVYIIGFKDFISQTEEILASTTIDANGYFQLTLKLDHPSPLILEIAFYRLSFYALPGSNWQFNSEQFQVTENGNPLLPQSTLPCYIHGPLTDSLLRNMNAQIADFLNSAAYEIYLKQNTAVLDTFTIKTLKINLFDKEFQEAASYQLATLYLGVRLPLGINAFHELQPKYQSWHFCNWLEDYLAKALTRENPLSANSGLTRDLIQAINQKEDLQTVRELLSQHFQIKDSLMEEVVTLAALKVFYRTPIYQNKSIINLIRQLKETTFNKDIAFIAENLVQRLTAFSPGNQVPPFELITQTGDTLNPATTKGKYSYFVFARKYCSSCLNSLELLRPLYERYKDKLQIICIFTSHDTLTESGFAKKMNYPWPVVIAGKNYDFLRTFQAFSLPLEILVNENGNIVAWPAYRAGEGLEAVLEKLLSKQPNPPKTPLQRKW
ncbi:MAG: hypothetical protein PWP35_347 [Bacteroidales bacterium]|nr:hypothetical protein [Bacteroidales bacterium]